AAPQAQQPLERLAAADLPERDHRRERAPGIHLQRLSIVGEELEEDRDRLRVLLLAEGLDGGLGEQHVGMHRQGAEGGAGLGIVDPREDLDAEEGRVVHGALGPRDHRGERSRPSLAQGLHGGGAAHVGVAPGDEFHQPLRGELLRGDLGGAAPHGQRGVGERLLDGPGRLVALTRTLEGLEEGRLGAHADLSGRRRCSTWVVSSVTFEVMPLRVSATRCTASWFWRATTLMFSMALSTCSPPARTWTVASATWRVRSEIRSTASMEERTPCAWFLALSERRLERPRMCSTSWRSSCELRDCSETALETFWTRFPTRWMDSSTRAILVPASVMSLVPSSVRRAF